MTKSRDAVRETAVRILVDVEHGARTDALLDAAALSDPRDRRFLHQIVAGTVKWRLRLDWIADAFARRPVQSLKPEVRNVLRLGIYQLLFLDRVPERAAVHTAVDLAKRFEHAGAGGFVNAVLRRVIERGRQVEYPDRGTDAEGHLSVMYSHPRWLVSRWLARWGADRTEDLLRANNEAPAVYVRRATADAPALPDGVESVEVDGFPGVRRVTQPESLFDSDAFRSGWVAQDVNAGLAVELLRPQPGDLVLDTCAAPGGKTAQLAAAGGRVVAADISAERLRQVGQVLQRLGARPVGLLCEDGRHAGVTGPFDGVLADVPCSGTGVLARHPEARWRKEEADLPRHAERQLALLEAAFERLRPGGVLVYSTCSLEEEENDAVVDGFLARRPDARLEVASQILPGRPWAQRTVQTLPGREPGDGAFAARLRRVAS
jgi:16S rRNA (cytosine967-C5)-methyltransferase